MVEIMLVAGLMVVFSLVAILNVSGRKSRAELDSTVQQMAALLREAQSRSVSQASSTSWGVYFHNSTATAPYYTLFAGTYSTSSQMSFYRLPANIRYVTSSLAAGATRTVTFAQITGLASASTSIRIELATGPALSSTIRIASSGAVSF
jgi:type II secretory pathway pseudopilin PulG